jgi:carboxymethylenebutenolidase
MASFWEMLRVPTDDGDLLDDMATYVSQPNVAGKHPAVIVIQEIFGVNSNIQTICDQFAAEGYFAVAPALFHREGTSEAVRGTNRVYGYGEAPDMEARQKAVGNWKDDELILDLNTTIEWLKSDPRVQGDRIGIVGFCAGGRITYLAAAACPGLSAASVFYGGRIMVQWGGGPTPFDRTANIQCPVMGSFGDQDQNPTVDDVSKIEAELKKSGKQYDFKMYPGAGHGFFCDERSSYHEPSAKDAWDRTLDWFKKHLSPVAARA